MVEEKKYIPYARCLLCRALIEGDTIEIPSMAKSVQEVFDVGRKAFQDAKHICNAGCAAAVNADFGVLVFAGLREL